MKKEIESDVKFVIKLIVYSTLFFIVFELFAGIYVTLVKHGMIFFYKAWKGLSYLDKRLQIYLKLQPTAVFFGLVFATPNIVTSKKLKFTGIGFVFFYFLDVLFASSQALMLGELLVVEYFIRFISVFVIWTIFSYDDYLREKFFGEDG